MKRKLKIGLFAVAGLLAAALVALWLNLSSLVKTGIETMGPGMTGCTVAVDSVSLSPLTGSGRIRGLVIGNPEGFSAEPALRLGEVRLRVALASLLSERILVEEILVASPDILYEAGLGSSNIGRIQENLEASAGASPGAASPGKGGKKVQIGRILVTDGRIRLSAKLLRGKALSIHLPDIEMRDVGKDAGGTSMAQAVSAFFGRLAAGIAEAAGKGASGLLDGVGKLFK